MDELLNKLLKEDEFDDTFKPISDEEHKERVEKTTFTFYRYGLWGNKKDGWEVNEIYPSQDDIRLPKGLASSNEEVLQTLVSIGIFNKDIPLKDIIVEEVDTGKWELSFAKSGKPIGQLAADYVYESKVNEDEFEDTFKPIDKGELGKRTVGLKKHLANGGDIPEDIEQDLYQEFAVEVSKAIERFAVEVKKEYPTIYIELIKHKQFKNYILSAGAEFAIEMGFDDIMDDIIRPSKK